MKKALWVTVFAAIVVAGVTHTLITNRKKHQQSPSPSQLSTTISEQNSSSDPKLETITVTYDENGFSPQNIEIIKGSTVNFINKSEIPLWVASDPHPEHTDYPEFDTPKATGDMPRMGEDFSFTFEKPGTWKYHSHTASGDVSPVAVHPGTVTVK